jgi:hypothetical protein
VEIEESGSKSGLGKSVKPYLKKKNKLKSKWTGSMTQVKALSSIPSTAKKIKKKMSRADLKENQTEV